MGGDAAHVSEAGLPPDVVRRGIVLDAPDLPDAVERASWYETAATQIAARADT